MFKLEISTENAAFHDTTTVDENGNLTHDFDDLARAHEIQRILRRIDVAIGEGAKSGSCIDLNGNKVGEWRIEE